MQDGSSAPKTNYERGGGSQCINTNCYTCGKKNCRKCLCGIGCCFGWVKDDHKVRDIPNIAARGREA